MHPGAKPPVRSPFPRVYGNRDTYIFVSLHRQPPGPPAESVLPDSERGRRNLQHKSRARWPSTRLSRVPSHIIYTAATSRTRHGSRTWQTRPSRRVESAKWQAVVCRVSSVVSFPRPPAPWFRLSTVLCMHIQRTYARLSIQKCAPWVWSLFSLSPIVIPSPQQTNFSLDLTMLATSATIKTQFARQSSLRSSRTKKTMMVKVRRMARWLRERAKGQKGHPPHSRTHARTRSYALFFALCSLRFALC